MIKEKAQVVAVEGEYALVQTLRRSTCNGCAANQSCGTSVLSKVLGQRYARMRVLNTPRANVGDTVLIALGESGLLKSALVVYCLPLLAIVLFVVLGQLTLGANFTEGLAIVFGLAGFVASLCLARLLSTRMASNVNYQPVILAVEPELSNSAPKFFIP
jgi:sigma-E factor negative regulatory protein RseC